MRFLPDTFDVLTNAQMKTFDGNRLEHSPVSNHTDHAIMGYEYKFKFLSSDHLWIMKKTIKSGFRWRPRDIYAHMNSNWANFLVKLSYSDIVAFFKEVKQDAFTGISFDVNYYVDSLASNDIYELKMYDPQVSNFPGERTASPDEIRTLLMAAAEAKLDVNVINKIYVSRAYEPPWGGLAFGGGLDPQNTSTFFRNYENLVLPLAKLLEEYHVKSWLVFDEMDTLEQSPDLIRRLFDDLSMVYSGELGIDEATNNMMTGDSYLSGEPPHQKSFEQIAGRCWDWADRRGTHMIRAYSCWAIPMETQKDQRASLMPVGFVRFWKPALDFYHQLFLSNPDMFGEIGVYDADGVCLGGRKY